MEKSSPICKAKLVFRISDGQIRTPILLIRVLWLASEFWWLFTLSVLVMRLPAGPQSFNCFAVLASERKFLLHLFAVCSR